MSTRIVNCVICGKHTSDVGPLSRKHKCAPCSAARAVAAAVAMRSKTGDEYQRWLDSAGPKGRPASL